MFKISESQEDHNQPIYRSEAAQVHVSKSFSSYSRCSSKGLRLRLILLITGIVDNLLAAFEAYIGLALALIALLEIKKARLA